MFIMDAHCDTLMDVVEGRRRLADKDRGGQLDLPRMMEAGVSAQIFAIYVSKSLPGGAPGSPSPRTRSTGNEDNSDR